MPNDHEYPSGHKTPRDKQLKVLKVLSRVRGDGITSREMAQYETPGDVSAVNGWGSCFTVLRQENLIIALVERREDHHVYVLPEYTWGRETWPGYRHAGQVNIKPFVIVRHCATCTCSKDT